MVMTVGEPQGGSGDVAVGGGGEDSSGGGNGEAVPPPSTSIMEEDEIRRLKEKRDRNRKSGMEEFIPLNGAGDDADHPLPPRALADLAPSAEELEAKMGNKKVRGMGGGGGYYHYYYHYYYYYYYYYYYSCCYYYYCW